MAPIPYMVPMPYIVNDGAVLFGSTSYGIDGINLQPEGFKILLEILVKGRIKKAVEVPYHFGNRYSGKSKASFKVALQYFTLLGKLSRHAFFGPGQQ